MCAVPLILERIYKSIVDTMRRQGMQMFHFDFTKVFIGNWITFWFHEIFKIEIELNFDFTIFFKSYFDSRFFYWKLNCIFWFHETFIKELIYLLCILISRFFHSFQGWAVEELFHYFVQYKMKWQDRGFDTPLLNKTLFRKIRYFLGGKVRLMLSGGAPLVSNKNL